eukprot:3940977-Pyramimonas_sp.AAC.2
MSNSSSSCKFEAFFSSYVQGCDSLGIPYAKLVSASAEAGAMWGAIYALQVPWKMPAEVISDCHPAIARVTSGLPQIDDLPAIDAQAFQSVKRVRAITATHTGGGAPTLSMERALRSHRQTR